MALKMNFVLQKSDLMLIRNERVFNGIKKTTNISCRAKELHNIDNKKNFYQVLSLESQNVSFHDLKKAYRAKALQLHPDVYPSSKKEESTKRFVELREAYEVLSDPNTRRMYDLSLVGGHTHREQNVHFSTTVWEAQLEGLKNRAAKRPKRRSIQFM
uniref:chaperone protein dnaJ 20, chloroplastic-like n=1 Tax=Erigeron canadensis TaxID=72917 RepID=UPI001CB90E70|nr:chaperone protein dnaJ 20, chloroplastic-like [Erigeron canadensis]